MYGAEQMFWTAYLQFAIRMRWPRLWRAIHRRQVDNNSASGRTLLHSDPFARPLRCGRQSDYAVVLISSCRLLSAWNRFSETLGLAIASETSGEKTCSTG